MPRVLHAQHGDLLGMLMTDCNMRCNETQRVKLTNITYELGI